MLFMSDKLDQASKVHKYYRISVENKHLKKLLQIKLLLIDKLLAKNDLEIQKWLSRSSYARSHKFIPRNGQSHVVVQNPTNLNNCRAGPSKPIRLLKMSTATTIRKIIYNNPTINKVQTVYTYTTIATEYS